MMEFRGGAISKSPFFFTTAILETRRSLAQAPASPLRPFNASTIHDLTNFENGYRDP
jgi:hypothetical protein